MTALGTERDKIPLPETGIGSTAGSTQTGSIHHARDEQALDYMHKLRMKAFDKRCENPRKVKPYLPMLISDEKEVIMEQYDAAKMQLNEAK